MAFISSRLRGRVTRARKPLPPATLGSAKKVIDMTTGSRRALLSAWCALAAATLAGCSFEEDVTPLPLADKATGVAALTPGWHRIETGGETLCSKGTPYSFFVRPGTVNRVLVDFRGGGACWDALTCSFADDLFDAEVTDDHWATNEETATGIYAHSRDDNPFKDWHHVYIPYCTGDIHWGDNEQTYGSGASALTIHHKGAVNVRAVLRWMQENVLAPEKVFVAGCSAGAYGSIMWSAHLREQYKDAKLFQLADSGVGIITDDFFQQSFPVWKTTSSYPTWIPALDPAQVTRLPQIYKAIGAYYPDMPLAQLTTNFDEAQSFYFEAMGGGDAQAWSTKMRASLDEISTSTPQFRSYISTGSEHCALPHDRFYTVEVNGRRLVDWVRDMAETGSVETVACTDCGAPGQ